MFSGLEKLNKGFDAETIKEFGLTEHDHIGGTYHKYNYVEKNINQAQVYRQIQTQNQFSDIPSSGNPTCSREQRVCNVAAWSPYT